MVGAVIVGVVSRIVAAGICGIGASPRRIAAGAFVALARRIAVLSNALFLFFAKDTLEGTASCSVELASSVPVFPIVHYVRQAARIGVGPTLVGVDVGEAKDMANLMSQGIDGTGGA